MCVVKGGGGGGVCVCVCVCGGNSWTVIWRHWCGWLRDTPQHTVGAVAAVIHCSVQAEQMYEKAQRRGRTTAAKLVTCVRFVSSESMATPS